MGGYLLDVLVMGGGGSGGFTAATTAMKAGARVGMVEAGRLGGLCILAGCMPSKALLHSAAFLKAQGEQGVQAYPRVIQRKRSLVDYLAGNREEAVKAKEALGLQVFRGRASLLDPHTVKFADQSLTADQIIVATGSRELIPDLPGLENSGYLTSETFMELDELPASLVVLGGGAVALEMAQYAARMGIKTSLIQRSARLLSKEPPLCGEIMAESLEKDGIEVLTNTQLTRIEAKGKETAVHFVHEDQEDQRRAGALLLALGRVANTQGLGLEEVGVELERDAVKVDRCMRTSQANIYAAGDVTGVNMVVNLAILQGEIAGYNATHPAEDRQIDDSVLPQAIFTEPQYARVGLSASQCEAAGTAWVEATQAMEDTGIARTYPEPMRGYVTLRAEKGTGRLLGADMVMPEASSMIHDIAVALKLGGTVCDLADIPYVHPCLAEITNYCAHHLKSKLDKLG